MKKILISILCLCTLTACSGTPSEKQTICSFTEENASSTVTITHDDKVLLKSAEEMVSGITSTKFDKEIVEMSLASNKATLEGIQGIVYNYEVTDESFTVNTIYDWQTIDMNKLVEMGMLPKANGNKIPVDEYIENLEVIGYTCK